MIDRSPLIGRDQELLTARKRLTAIGHLAQRTSPSLNNISATFGPAQCMLFTGDVGIGKTRLAEEIGNEAKENGWRVVWGRAYAFEQHLAYRLWIEVLRKLRVTDIQQQELNSRLQFYRYLRPWLSDVWDDPVPEEQKLFFLWEAVQELLVTISQKTPLLIVLDDLHWADVGSYELLTYLAHHSIGYPIMIISTCRDVELSANHPLRKILTDLHRAHLIEILSLQPLSDEQITLLVTSVLQAPEMIQAVSMGAAGNPFFAEELARAMRAGATPDMSSDVLALPDTITAVLDLRLDHVSIACYHLLRKAAVIGRSFELDVLLSLTRDQLEDQVISTLEEALQMGLLTEEEHEGTIIYHFWHPLLVNHLYGQLSAARRMSLHAHLSKGMDTLENSSKSSVLSCGTCSSSLTFLTTREKYREIVKQYSCPHCLKRYEIQFVQISILVSSPDEDVIALARECSLCHTLYQDGEEHQCCLDQREEDASPRSKDAKK